MEYDHCGNSGLMLPKVSLGLWHNFGDTANFENMRKLCFTAFDSGITQFDLANNYGPEPGSAEKNFGRILKEDLGVYRDELIITTKAGYEMWDGPYGDGSSRKYIMASIDQSLKRTGLEYFDIFYSHRYDPQTPIEETMQALIDIVRQGKALYIGISKYPPEKLIQAYDILKSQHVPCLIYQDKYSMLVRNPEAELMAINEKYGVGFIAFSPIAQGVLTNKYLKGIPETSRAHKSHGFLQESEITPEVIKKVSALNGLAAERGQTLAEMALAWLLHNRHVTSVIVGTSSLKQLEDNLKATDNTNFSDEELRLIGDILNQ